MKISTSDPAAAILALFSALATAMPSATATASPRVASTSMCADEYVLLLADRTQIASLSRQARSPLSVYADRAADLKLNHRDVEEMVQDRVDLVVDDGGDRRFSSALAMLGIKTVGLAPRTAYTVEEIESTVERVADAVGHHDRAAAINADIRARVAALNAEVPPFEHRPIIAYFRPDGGGAGSETFVDTALSLGGFRNLQALAGQHGWQRMSMEDVIQNPPQAFVISFFDTRSNSLSAVRGRNPLLGRFDAPVINTPGKLWICLSPSLIAAAESLRSARLQLFPETKAAAR
jgi:iron complex transport system substrate-binding protein